MFEGRWTKFSAEDFGSNFLMEFLSLVPDLDVLVLDALGVSLAQESGVVGRTRGAHV